MRVLMIRQVQKRNLTETNYLLDNFEYKITYKKEKTAQNTLVVYLPVRKFRLEHFYLYFLQQNVLCSN